MVEQVRNVIKQDSKEVPCGYLMKIMSKGVDLLRHYTVNTDCTLDSENP